MEIDPMLAAEMIYRSSQTVWNAIQDQVLEFVARWHTPGSVDRAVRFMIMTGKPNFAPYVWPLILHESDQVYLSAFRAADRFRPSVLGPDLEGRVAELSEVERQRIASNLAFEGSIDGMEVAARIATLDGCAKVKRSVIKALEFRRADKLALEVLRTASEEVWSAMAREGFTLPKGDPDIETRLVREREHQIEAESDPLQRLNALLEKQHGAKVGGQVASLIESPRFPVREQRAVWAIHEAYRSYPAEVRAALFRRLEARLDIPFRSEEIFETADIAMDEGPVVDFALGDDEPTSVRIASLGILGPRPVGRLIDKLLAVKTDLDRREHRAEKEAIEQFQKLRGWISTTRLASFVGAILKRATTVIPDEIGFLADLISRHGKPEGSNALEVPPALRTELIEVLARWAEDLLTSSSSSRSHLAEVAMAMGRLSAPELGPVLGRMLAEDLARWRDAREQMRLAQERRETITPALRSSAQTGYSLLYRRAFAATGGDYVVALMKSYLPSLGFDRFGVDAAHVLRQIWEEGHSPNSERRIVMGMDFSEVPARRMERARAGGGATSSFAETIFTVIEELLSSGSSDEGYQQALQLAVVAFGLPHGDKARIVNTLLDLPQSLREKKMLLSALVFGGETVPAEMVLDGLKGVIEEGKGKPWLSDSTCWELDSWLALMPFSDRPMATLEGWDLIDGPRRQPWGLRNMLRALGYAPSRDAESVLKELPRRDERFLSEQDWITALERRSPLFAARTLLEFIAEGAFSTAQVRDRWWLSRKLGAGMEMDESFRSEIYRQYELASEDVARELLEAAIAEAADETGVLLIVRNHAKQGKAYSGSLERAVRHAVVGERPSPEWSQAREVFPIVASSLRKALFTMIECGTSEAGLAKRCLSRIDELRDEYGPAQSEPRHPDIESGLPWPVEVR